MRIERHDLNRQGCFLPFPFSKPECWNEELVRQHATECYGGFSFTLIQELRYNKAAGKRLWHRFDIVLINEEHECRCDKCGNKHSDIKQFTVSPDKNGTLTGRLDKLSPENLEWAKEESKKCWETALAEPLYMEAFYNQ